MNALRLLNLALGFMCFGLASSFGQPIYNDYIGAGHSQGITVTASSQMEASTAIKTIDGSGMDARYFEAGRFLTQAGFGGKKEAMENVLALGFDGWIDDQFTKPTSYISPLVRSIWREIIDGYFALGQDTTELYGPYSVHFNYAWWQNNLTNEDVLRHRVANALSEILVISYNSDLSDRIEGINSYYDMLLDHSFGNYKDLMTSMALHPAMGYYLSHLNNPKTDTITNIRPDENFAREIMQLFSIGLLELNPDGTPVLDQDGNPIPTYDNNTIKNMAKVWTGLYGGKVTKCPYDPDLCEQWWPDAPFFGMSFYITDLTAPMVMDDNFHEPGSKTLLNGYTIPAGQSGMKDISDAIDHLFNHPNVGPFVAQRLIQRMVKSNPSPAYVGRVAAKFANNGQGMRGDMKAVIKQILLDEEARSEAGYLAEDNGMLRNPTLRMLHIGKALDLISPLGHYWNNGYSLLASAGHHPMASPSVFNFYLPDYQPVGPIKEANLVAPEFKIHNTSTSIKYINETYAWTFWNAYMWSWNNEIDSVIQINTTYFESIAHDPERMINELDVLLYQGNLSDQQRNILRNTMEQIYWAWDENWRWWRVRTLLFFSMWSPDFVIQK